MITERKVICIEGKEFAGRKTFVMKGAIYIDDADTKIPIVTITGSAPSKLLGYARNLQRDIVSGEVSMELTIHPMFDVNLEEFDATVSLHPVMTSRGKDGETTIINAGRLREVCLIWERPS